MKNDKIKLIGRYFFFLFMNILVINIVLFYNFYTVNSLQSSQYINIIKKTIDEFHEIDLQHLCVVSNCKEIGFLEEKSYELTKGILKRKDYNKPEILINLKGFTLTKNLKREVRIPEYNLYVHIKSRDVILKVLNGYLNINILFFILFTIAYSFMEFKMYRKRLLDLVSTSNMLREKNMQILTENIHHELNTPIAIIHGNIKKLEIEMETSPDACISCQRQYYFDFGQIYSSIEQIDTVLQRMSNFKNLKYSNGNKSLLDIISYSSNSMCIYKNPNFKIELDENLINYGLKGPLKNGDLLNIVSNHFRNSIEANSTKIKVQGKLDKYNDIMHLYIIDNGTGLRDRVSGLLLQKDKYNDIFKPYYSSKDALGISICTESQGIVKDTLTRIMSVFTKKHIKNNVRGIGLYLNKELLNENDGDLKLRETTTKGTVFEITFPIKYK